MSAVGRGRGTETAKKKAAQQTRSSVVITQRMLVEQRRSIEQCVVPSRRPQRPGALDAQLGAVHFAVAAP